MATRYSYPPLRCSTCVRLLVFQKNPTFTLSFGLKEVNLEDNPKYQALSYTWQDPDGDTSGGGAQEASINVAGNASIPITRNLDAILKHLSNSPYENSEVRRIWIDQICINQTDSEERSQQVSIMDRIYGQADKTFIWLGRPNEHTPIFLDLMDRFMTPPFDYKGRLVDSLLTDLVYRLETIFKDDADYNAAMLELLNRNWFTRAWVVQEAALSRTPLVIQGDKSFDFRLLDRLLIATARLAKGKSGSIRDLEVLKTPGAQMLRNVQTCRERLLSDIDGRGRVSFLDILRKLTIAVDSTDPRDRVYAFLAFQDPTLPSITPDYELSVHKAYAKVSASIIQNTGSLAVLGLTRRSLCPDWLPTWAVDWRLDKSTQGAPFDSDVKHTFNAACGRQHRKGTLQPHAWNKLILRGKIIDEVKSVSPVYRPRSRPDIVASLRLVDEMENADHLLPTRNMTPEEKHDLITRILATLIAYDPGPSLVDREEFFLELNNLLFTHNHFTSISTRAEYSDNEPYFKRLAAHIRHGSRMCLQKRLFIGSRKPYLGLGPQYLVPGDKICILHGSTVPCILRQGPWGYTVVGQCYLENWMYGVGVNWEEDKADEFVVI